jgi:hypothetical protein
MDKDSKFDSELRDLVLTAFAEGAEVTGERAVTTVPDKLPDWEVTIERRDEKSATSGSPVGESP